MCQVYASVRTTTSKNLLVAVDVTLRPVKNVTSTPIYLYGRTSLPRVIGHQIECTEDTKFNMIRMVLFRHG